MLTEDAPQSEERKIINLLKELIEDKTSSANVYYKVISKCPGRKKDQFCFNCIYNCPSIIPSDKESVITICNNVLNIFRNMNEYSPEMMFNEQ